MAPTPTYHRDPTLHPCCHGPLLYLSDPVLTRPSTHVSLSPTFAKPPVPSWPPVCPSPHLRFLSRSPPGPPEPPAAREAPPGPPGPSASPSQGPRVPHSPSPLQPHVGGGPGTHVGGRRAGGEEGLVSPRVSRCCRRLSRDSPGLRGQEKPARCLLPALPSLPCPPPAALLSPPRCLLPRRGPPSPRPPSSRLPRGNCHHYPHLATIRPVSRPGMAAGPRDAGPAPRGPPPVRPSLVAVATEPAIEWLSRPRPRPSDVPMTTKPPTQFRGSRPLLPAGAEAAWFPGGCHGPGGIPVTCSPTPAERPPLTLHRRCSCIFMSAQVTPGGGGGGAERRRVAGGPWRGGRRALEMGLGAHAGDLQHSPNNHPRGPTAEQDPPRLPMIPFPGSSSRGAAA